MLTRLVSLARRFAPPTLLLLGLGLGVRARFFAPLSVEATKLDRGAVVEEAFGRGTIESQREAAVGFDLAGRLSDVLVEEGTRVSLGQALARLETNQAVADLRSAQTGVVAARASLSRLAADEDRARALLSTADREAARTGSLVASGALPSLQGDDAADRVRLARAELDRVLAQRSEATRSIDLAAGGAEQRRVTMVRATLLAPFDGLVIKRLREPGDTVTVGSTVLRLVDTSRVFVGASIDETVIARLAVDQVATITFPGDAAPLVGRVTQIPWEADRQTHELVVEVTPDKLDRRVAIGQRADVRIALARRDAALRVPTRLLQRDGQGSFVYVDRQGKISIARPTLGLVGQSHVEVLAGLVEGDLVLAPQREAGSPPKPLTEGRRWRAP
jgi:HlyD family secretion protein